MSIEKCSKAEETRARRVAKRNGLVAHKSRRMISCDNLGGFMLINRYTGGFVAGAKFELTAEDVIAYCQV